MAVDLGNSRCLNPACTLRGKVSSGNIVRHGFYRTRSGKRRRYRCGECGKTFSSTKGTPYYRLQHRRATFDGVIALRVEGVSISSISAHSRESRGTGDGLGGGGPVQGKARRVASPQERKGALLHEPGAYATFASGAPGVDAVGCLRCLLLVMCTYPFAKKSLTLHFPCVEGRERYLGCNSMQRKVLASSHQHLTAEAPVASPKDAPAR